MLVIHPDECIDCGVCVPECPVDAIKPDTESGLEKWLSLNAEYAKTWPNITVKKERPADSKDWEGRRDKLQSRRGRLMRAVPAQVCDEKISPRSECSKILRHPLGSAVDFGEEAKRPDRRPYARRSA